MATVFRVESPEGLSLWRDAEGHETLLAERIGLKKAAAMPMPFDETMRMDGLSWFSAVDQIDDFRALFGIGDIERIYRLGFRLWAFETPLVMRAEWHPVFVRDGASRVELPFSMVRALDCALPQGAA